MKQWRAYLVGALAGAAALAVVIFATGAMVTSGTSEDRAFQAVVDVQTQICEGRARAYLEESGDEVDLKGRDKKARDKRDELARKFAPILSGDEAADSAVVKACADRLRD